MTTEALPIGIPSPSPVAAVAETPTAETTTPTVETSLEGSQAPETVVAEPSPEEAKALAHEKKVAAKFAALDREKKALRQYETKMKAEQQRIDAMNQAWQSAKANPLKLLEQAGLSFDAVAAAELDRLTGKTPEPDKNAEIEQRLARIEQQKQWELEQASLARYNQDYSDGMRFIASFIDTNKETYELVAHNDAKELLYSIMQEKFNETGQINVAEAIKEAAQLAEDYFYEQGTKLLKSKKFAPKPVTVEGEQLAEEKRTQHAVKATPTAKTLTNKNTAQTTQAKSGKRKTLEERDQEAIAMLKNAFKP